MASQQLSRVVRIFFSYDIQARRDRTLLEDFKKHMDVLRQQWRDVATFFDSDISAGTNRRQVIDNHINKADIIVLFINNDLLTSEQGTAEITRAFELCETGQARVISVFLRPTIWKVPCTKSYRLPPENKEISKWWLKKDIALMEVVRGIGKVVEELGQFVRGHTPKLPPRTLQRQNMLFTGREDLLVMLHDHFSSDHPSRMPIQALTGPGGIGKTQIAVEYMYRYGPEYQHIFWLQADSHEIFSEEIATLADQLPLAEKDLHNEEQRLIAVRYWLARHDKWLLILDNIDDYTLVDLIVPATCNGHVLLTAQFGATGSLAHGVPVTPMTIDEGTRFLLRRAKKIFEHSSQDITTLTDYALARQIVHEMDNYPLALDQAGAYIEETGKGLANYLALYRQRPSELLHRRGHFPNGHPESVKQTLSLAFERVIRVHPAAIDLLSLLAFLHPDAIPKELIERGIPKLHGSLRGLARDLIKLDAVIEVLLRFSLIHCNTDTTMLSIHRVVQVILQDRLTSAEHHRWKVKVVRMVNHVFPHANFNNRGLCQRYLPQAQKCAEYIAHEHLKSSDAGQLLYRLGRYCYERALYTEAETYLTHALHIYERLPESRRSDNVHVLNALGQLYGKIGQYQRAEDFLQRALTLQEQISGSDHPETASVLNNLAFLYYEQNRYALAEPLYKRALASYKEGTTTDDIERANTLNNLGLLYHKLKKYALAEPFYQRSLTIREATWPDGHPRVTQSLNNIGTLYQDQGKYEQAEPLLVRALVLSEKTQGLGHPDTALSLNNLAMLYYDKEQYQQAEPLLIRAVEIYEHALDPEHPDTAFGLGNLALVYRARGYYEQAEALYLRALVIYEHTFGESHTSTALTLHNLGRLYCAQRRYKEAEAPLQRALAIREQILDSEDPEVALSLEHLAELYSFLEKYEQAEPLYQRALSIYQQTLGATHPNSILAMEAYATLLEQTGSAEDAKALRYTAEQLKKQQHHRSPQ